MTFTPDFTPSDMSTLLTNRFVAFRAVLCNSIPEKRGFAPPYVVQPQSRAGRAQKKGAEDEPQPHRIRSAAAQDHQSQHQQTEQEQVSIADHAIRSASS